MSLFTQTLNTFTGLLAEEGSFGLNLDIFESNLINLIILGGGIFKLGSKVLSESLIARQENIAKTIEDSEKRLEKAIVKLDESQKQLVQSGMIVSNINEDSEKTAKQVKTAILNDGKIEVERITVSAKNQVITMESIIRKEISAHVVNEALKIVTSKLEEQLDVELQNKIIDKNISKIKD